MARVFIMNVKLVKNIPNWNVTVCALATQAAVQHKVQIERTTLPKQSEKVTTLPNGMIVASVEDYSPVTRLAVMVKAGPRYEDSKNLGISHCLRNCAGLSTTHSTVFGITRNVEHIGANMSVVTTREHVTYMLECVRDSLHLGAKFLGEVVAQPAFKPWEVGDHAPQMKLDLDELATHPEAILVEALHQAAFRGGLSHSLYSPDFMIGKHKPAMLHEYFRQNFTCSRTALVGVGVDHDHLVNYAQTAFSLPGSSGSETGASKYGGGEVRLEMGLPYVYAAVVAEGASSKNQKDMLALALLQRILGTGPHVKYGSGAAKLHRAAAKATASPVAVSALNMNYSDTGLFGFWVAAQPDEMNKVVKAVVAQMREVGKGISEQEVKAAKHGLKAALLMARESSTSAADDMACRVLAGQPLDLSETEKAVEAIALQDVQGVAAKVTKAKPSMAAVGRLHNTPHLDDLL